MAEQAGGAVTLAHDHDPKTEDRVLASLCASLDMAERAGMKILSVSQLLANSN